MADAVLVVVGSVLALEASIVALAVSIEALVVSALAAGSIAALVGSIAGSIALGLRSVPSVRATGVLSMVAGFAVAAATRTTVARPALFV